MPVFGDTIVVEGVLSFEQGRWYVQEGLVKICVTEYLEKNNGRDVRITVASQEAIDLLMVEYEKTTK